MRVMLGNVIAVSQMSDPVDGTGNGGDRCTEAMATDIDCTFRLGPLAKTIDNGADPHAVATQIMYQLTQLLNNGSNVSHLEDFGVWFPQWLQSNGYSSIISLNNVSGPSWSDVTTFIDRGHMAVIGVNDYTQLKLFNGGDPYQWPENAANAGGHVLMLVGYDDNWQGTGEKTLIVDDPLRSFSGQPYDYQFSSFSPAGFSDLTEVVAPALPITGLPSGKDITVDVSSWQGTIDWPTLITNIRKQSSSGRAQVIMRASQDVATKDANFEANWSGAVAAGADSIVVYHYSYPQNDSAQAEADWFNQVVGSRLRPRDRYMLDFEENNASATDAWVLAFRDEMQKLTGREIVVYENLNMVQTHMHDPALASIPLILADWTFDPNNLPSCPAPFTDMIAVQYSDKGSMPGVSGAVDMDVFLTSGVSSLIQGPFVTVHPGYDGVETSGNALAAHFGLTWQEVVDISDPSTGQDNSHLQPYDPSGPYLYRASDGFSTPVLVPGYPAINAKIDSLKVEVDTANKAEAAAQKAASDAQAAQAKAESDAKGAQDALNTEQGKNLVLTGTVNDLGRRIDSLNHDVASEHAAYLHATQQLAAEMNQVKDLSKQVADLRAASKQPENEDLKTQLQELADSLHLFPEVKKVVDSIISKL